MNTFNIGTEINRPILKNTRLLVTGGSGSGKSYALRKIMEENSGHIPMIILDIEGEFVTLREQFPFALGALHDGDLPIAVQYAEILARKIIETRLSVIIDLYDLKAHERIQFVDKFLRALMNLPKNLWLDTLVFIDEAHLFCPQSDKSLSGNAVIDVMTRGRKRGICGILSTQRLAKLHKDAAAECQNKMIGKTTMTIDMDRSADELGMNRKEGGAILRNLKPGEFLCAGPAFINEDGLTTDGKIEVAPVKTTHAKGTFGQFITTPTSLKEILATLQDIPQQAEQELETIEQLRDEIGRLKGALKKTEANPNERFTDALRLATQQRDQHRTELITLRGELGKAWGIASELSTRNARFQTALHQIADIYEARAEDLDAKEPVVIPFINEGGEFNQDDFDRLDARMHRKPHIVETSRQPAHPSPELVDMKGVDEHGEFTQTNMDYGHGMVAQGPREYSGIKRVKTQFLDGVVITETLRDDGPIPMYIPSLPDKLGRCERNVLEFLAAHGQEFTKYQIATGTGYTQTSGGFKNALSALASANLILRSPSGIRANWPAMSSAIINFVGPVFDKKVSAATYADKLGKCERTVLEFLVKHPGTAYTKSEIAEINGYSVTSGGFKNALSCLASLGMIDRTLVGIRLMPGLPVK